MSRPVDSLISPQGSERFRLVVRPFAVWFTVVGFAFFIVVGVAIIAIHLFVGPIVPGNFDLEAGISCLIFTAIGISICYSQCYELTSEGVRFRSGLITLGQINYDQITAIERSRGWPMSYTMHPVRGIALRKLRGRFFAIPREDEAFLRALQVRAPSLHAAIDTLLGEPARPDGWYPRAGGYA